MAVIGNLKVISSVDTTRYDRGLQRMQASNTKFSKSSSAIFSRAGGWATVAIAVGVVGKKFIDMAADVEEADSKLQQIFKNSTHDVERWAEATSRATGRSANELKSFAADMGAILKPMGLGAAKTKEFSQAMSQLAVDLSSFHNVSEDAALASLRSGLTGESEPLKRYGILINEAKVKTELLRMGVKKINGEYSDAAKVQARYNLIMEQTKDSQGDAERTADSYTNGTRKLKAGLHDLGVEIGKVFLPLGTGIVKVLNEMVDGAKAATKSIIDLGTGINSFAVDAQNTILDEKIAERIKEHERLGILEMKNGEALAQLGQTDYSGNTETFDKSKIDFEKQLAETSLHGYSEANKERLRAIELLNQEYVSKLQNLQALKSETTNAVHLKQINKELADVTAQYNREVQKTNEAYNMIDRANVYFAIKQEKQALEDAIATYGMTTDQIRIYSLTQQAMALNDEDGREAMLDHIEALKTKQAELAKLNKAEKENIKLQRERIKAENEASSIRQGLSPVNQFRAEAEKAFELFNKGLLSESELKQRIQNLKDQFGPEKNNKNVGPRFAGAFDINSREARSLILGAQNNEPTKKQLEESRKQTQIQNEINTSIKDLQFAFNVTEVDF